MHVVDLADAHLKALEKLEHTKGFVCNLGTGKGSSVLEVIDAFEKANGIRIPYEFAPRRDGDVTEAWANPAYAKELLGWESKHDLESMLRDAWHWQSKNPKGYQCSYGRLKSSGLRLRRLINSVISSKSIRDPIGIFRCLKPPTFNSKTNLMSDDLEGTPDVS